MGLLDKVKNAMPNSNSMSKEEKAEEVVVAKAAHDKKIEDVLEVIQITATFEIPNEVFMPEDIKSVQFDTQVPHGYDEGQVMRFVSQTRASVKFFTELLRKRNDDIAKLASVIDKLQVDANNLRFENEIANGISLMPTMDDDDLENQLMEAKLVIRNLEDQLKAQPASGNGLPMPDGTTGGVPKETYEAVLDELSIEKNRNAKLEEDLFTAKSRLAAYDDDADDELDDNSIRASDLSDDEYKSLGVTLPSNEEIGLPSADGERTFKQNLPSPGQLSSGRTFSVYDEEEEEDTLDDLMRHLKG